MIAHGLLRLWTVDGEAHLPVDFHTRGLPGDPTVDGAQLGPRLLQTEHGVLVGHLLAVPSRGEVV